MKATLFQVDKPEWISAIWLHRPLHVPHVEGKLIYLTPRFGQETPLVIRAYANGKRKIWTSRLSSIRLPYIKDRVQTSPDLTTELALPILVDDQACDLGIARLAACVLHEVWLTFGSTAVNLVPLHFVNLSTGRVDIEAIEKLLLTAEVHGLGHVVKVSTISFG